MAPEVADREPREKIPRHILLLLATPYVVLAIGFGTLVWRIHQSTLSTIRREQVQNCLILQRGRNDNNKFLTDIVSQFPINPFTTRILDQIKNRPPIDCDLTNESSGPGS